MHSAVPSYNNHRVLNGLYCLVYSLTRLSWEHKLHFITSCIELNFEMRFSED